jgi:hypothetical protein
MAAVAVLGACTLPPEGAQPVTPQRPTYSSSTATTADETFELEAGVDWDPGDFFGSPLTLKYGAGRATEVFSGWSPWVVVDQPGDTEAGVGDLSLGIRHRLFDEGKLPSFALQSAVKLPTAGDDLGSGELDAAFAGILTQDFAGTSVTGYYQLDFLGDPAGGTDLGHGLALAAGRTLVDKFGLTAELAGVFVPEQDLDLVFTTLSANYAVADWLVLDAGVVLGLSEEAPATRLVIGFTQNFGTVFGSAKPPPE